MKTIVHKTIKIVIGTIAGISIAKLLNLNNYTSAGIVAILSIQNTRKESLKLAVIRILASILALTISPIVFYLFDYTIYSFGLFLVIFVPICLFYKLNDGIVINSVLVSRLLIQKSSTLSDLNNELLIMLIGVMSALFVNIYMPRIEKTLIGNQNYIEKLFREIISQMSKSLREHVVSIKEEHIFNDLENILENAKEDAFRNLNNHFFINEDYHVSYINMRYQQFIQLRRMREHLKRLFITYSVTLYVADFIDKIALSIGRENSAEPLLEELQKLRIEFKQIELPKTREEFENRAMLYQFLNDLEQFLEIKKDFHQKYDSKMKLIRK